MENSENKDKRTYKIGEVAKLLQIEPYVLRYWESEFPQLDPLRSPKGQRLYTEEDIQLLRRIKALLYQQKLTIEGAKRKLEENQKWWSMLTEIKSELYEIKDLLNKKNK